MDSVKIAQDISKDSKFIEILIAFIGALLAVATIWIRTLLPKIQAHKQKKIIKYDQDNLIKAFQEVQDLTLKIGAIRGHAVFYENHGPQKFSVMFEAKGNPCGDCISRCIFYDAKNGIKRVSKHFNKRKVHTFWLIDVVNKTLLLDGKVNTVTYQDAIGDIEQTEIWDEVGTHMIKECFVKPKGNHEFITVVFEFCKRLSNVNHVDVQIENLANSVRKLL